MTPAVGPHDQVRQHMHVLRRLSDRAITYDRKLRKGHMPGDVIDGLYETGIMDACVFLELNFDRRQPEVVLDDETFFGLPLDAERPVESLLNVCAAFTLPKSDDEALAAACPLFEQIAARYEKALREASGRYIETDGLTAYMLALEAAREKDVDRNLVKIEIQQALTERRLPTGLAAELIRKGWKSRLNVDGPNTSHWDHPTGHTGRGIAKISYQHENVYEGQAIGSSVHFSSKIALEGSYLKIKTGQIPEAVIASLADKDMERLVDEERLHGWQMRTVRLISSTKDAASSKDEININLDTNRHAPECRMCFGI